MIAQQPNPAHDEHRENPFDAVRLTLALEVLWITEAEYRVYSDLWTTEVMMTDTQMSRIELTAMAMKGACTARGRRLYRVRNVEKGTIVYEG